MIKHLIRYLPLAKIFGQCFNHNRDKCTRNTYLNAAEPILLSHIVTCNIQNRHLATYCECWVWNLVWVYIMIYVFPLSFLHSIKYHAILDLVNKIPDYSISVWITFGSLFSCLVGRLIICKREMYICKTGMLDPSGDGGIPWRLPQIWKLFIKVWGRCQGIPPSPDGSNMPVLQIYSHPSSLKYSLKNTHISLITHISVQAMWCILHLFWRK